MAKLTELAKGVAGVFVEFEEREPLQRTQEVESPVVNLAPAAVTEIVKVSESDPAYIELSKAVLDRDSAYTKFLKRFNSLGKVKDLDTRYQATLDVLSSEGISKEDILKSIGSHVGLLRAEKTNFESTFNGELEESVGAFKKEIVENGKAINANLNEISRLQTENTVLDQKTKKLQIDVATEEQKVAGVVGKLLAAASAIAKKLESDKNKLASLS